MYPILRRCSRSVTAPRRLPGAIFCLLGASALVLLGLVPFIAVAHRGGDLHIFSGPSARSPQGSSGSAALSAHPFSRLKQVGDFAYHALEDKFSAKPAFGIGSHFERFLKTLPREDLLWLTLADGYYIRTATRHLGKAISDLPAHPSPSGQPRNNTLVVLCLEEWCQMQCQQDPNIHCFDGFIYNRPEIMLQATWPKLAGLITVLEMGREVVFVDSDVFIRGNILDRLEALGSHDLQISDDGGYTVNTGFMHIMPTPENLMLWRKLLALDLVEISRDQRNTNLLLGKRTKKGIRAFRSEFFQKVYVIPVETILPWHVTYDDGVQLTDSTTAFHGTCLDHSAGKYYMARDLGFWQDMDGYYSNPPDLLVLMHLNGSTSEIRNHFEAAADLAAKLGRTLLPPAEVQVTLDEEVELPNGSKVQTIQRAFSQIFDVENLVEEKRLPVREPDYVKHAMAHLRVAPGDSQGARVLEKLTKDIVYLEFDSQNRPVLTREGRPFVPTDTVLSGTVSDYAIQDRKVWDVRMCQSPELPTSCFKYCRK